METNHFCCENLKKHALSSDIFLTYVEKFREYGIDYRDEGSYQTITHCPWCGTKLPSSLREEWFEVLDEISLEPEDCIPEEMHSSKWWKAKNL
ncbi:DUF6980 family protein [Paracidovorax konjaci]|uniref:DUF6980 family protein n=1 Tax=Paracidovorax konjaci TaxID=32040 RepID=UPI001113C035|nr:hypothetical protein [Paracidovorax konjaci]